MERYEGEPIAMALKAAGVEVHRFTAKRHEPRGIFCAIIPSLASETCFAGGRAGTVGGYLPLDERAVARSFSLMLA